MIPYVLAFIALATLFYLKFVKPLNYWDDRGVPNVRGIPVFGKQAPVLFRQISLLEWLRRTYKECPGTRYHGSHQFNRPVLVIKDPDLIKQVLIKQFSNFVNRIDIVNKHLDPLLGNSLLFLHNEDWKAMRSTLSPAFTGSKMKDMSNLMMQMSHKFFEYLSKNRKSKFAVDMKDLSTRFTNDIIASCAYGVECNSLKDKNNDIYSLGKNMTNISFTRIMRFFGFSNVPKLMKFFNITVFSNSTNKKFSRIIKESLAARENSNIVRPDMIHLLMMAKRGKLEYQENVKDDNTGFATVEEHYTKDSKILTDDDIVSQAFIFFFAGFEPVSNAISFMGLELALNPDIQDKLVEEIDAAGEIDYCKLSELKYLDMVVSETLRKWPSVPVVNRRCTVPFVLKAERPGEKDLHIMKENGIIIPTVGLHYDEKYYPNPNKFDPERFSDENKEKINRYTYLPFGNGPRNCIGSRFALMEIKMFFAVALKFFRIEAIEKTVSKIEMDPKQFLMTPKGGFCVGFALRSKQTNI